MPASQFLPFAARLARSGFEVGLAVVLGWTLGSVAVAQSDQARMAFFENKIRPIFVEHCYSCHSADAKKVRGAFKLDNREDFLKGGTDGVVIMAGRPEQSSLIRAVRYEDADFQMPPNKNGAKKLPDSVIADLVKWVQMGAPYPETPTGKKPDGPKSWAFSPIKSPTAPIVNNKGWSSTSIDSFILAKIEQQGGHPAAPADKRTLIRRATFDLTGLPPTPEEIDAFLNDHSAKAFAKVVDRLLNSPAYGEHWGRHWLDIVRYADTAGDTADYPVGLAWRYRNYVIDAFNSDKPYDKFVREQIAGDILAELGPRARYAEQVTATGFIAISRRFGFDSENYHHLTIQDTLDTLGQTVLGLSLGCARCHDHKFDPVSMKDYYALYGIFASSRYSFPGSEQKGKMRAMVPLLPREESQPKWREYDQHVAALSDQIAQLKGSVPSAVYRSLHDPDGDFETQKDAAGGSYGVIVPPWVSEGKMSVSLGAQSPFKNFYPLGKFGASIVGGSNDYRLANAIQVRHRKKNSHLLLVNLDFRVSAPEPAVPGQHRFWIGTGSNSPAVEILISTEAVFTRSGLKIEKLADLKPNAWHNLQLTLDLNHRHFSGILTQAEGSITFTRKPFASNWEGAIDLMQLDSQARSGAALPNLEVDNFGVQFVHTQPSAPKAQTLTVARGWLSSEALSLELLKLAGADGDLEWQTENHPPVKPWNAGPNSVVKISASSQSPYRNIFPAGKLGLHMPNRAGYDGFGLALAKPWTAARGELIVVAFDFRLGQQEVGGEGSWRYYIGHGAGNAAAVELFFNDREFFITSGAGHQVVAPIRSGQWYQVQLSINLKDKTYTGTLAFSDGSTPFGGDLAKAFDGTIDYTFIDSYGHRTGVRPALDADNFAFGESALAPLSAQVSAETENERESRRFRVANLRKQIAAMSEEAARAERELAGMLVAGPCAMTYGVVEGTPQNAHLQMRGEPDRPGEESPRGFIKSLGGGPLPPGTTGSGRLELARWLTAADNPLTPRVMINRIWQYHFGRGLVTTPNDFGARGQPPTHPELLDHLATQFVQGGWSIKALHRLIMLSATYKQDEVDSESYHNSAEYAGFERRRLSAEELRDSILAISGELDRTPGNEHPFPSPVSSAYTQHGPFSAVYEHNQRSVYLMTQRLKRHPFLALFDGPDPNATTADRRTTTVPTQALFFLNSPFVHEKSAKCASRLRSARPDDAQRVDLAWQLTTGRLATETERAEAIDFLAKYRAELIAAGQADPETGALAAYVRSLFGSNEFLHLD